MEDDQSDSSESSSSGIQRSRRSEFCMKESSSEIDTFSPHLT